ncbi:peptidoglycan-binding protein [Streptomyces mexicanus]|uniref:peptidoglycan-binding protein n=1 Tax=Streptomyces mexicanus TaxID=178566 RepID=UPI0031EDAE91
MSRWKELPEELNPRVRQLVVRLRRLKDHSGLSLRQLAAKTGYSAKSWERYLGGRSLPPRDAVEALARIGADDPTRLLALYEVAAEAWEREREAVPAPARGHDHRAAAPRAEDRAGETADAGACGTAAPCAGTGLPAGGAAGSEREQPGPRGRALHITVVAGVVTLVLAVSSVVLVLVRNPGGDGRTAAHLRPSTTPSTAAASSPAVPAYTCRFERRAGQWYAGNSRTQDAVLANGLAGPDIAEAQCLLRRAGFSPGDVDGIYGPLTENAVKRLQKRAGLVVDGIVGPHTWKALRG